MRKGRRRKGRSWRRGLKEYYIVDDKEGASSAIAFYGDKKVELVCILD